jgi:hypothetical protein
MKTFNRLGLAIVCAAALSAMVAASARADTIYTYTGKDFNIFGPNPFLHLYTASDFVSVTFDLATPIADGAVNVSLAPVSFSFSDGVRSLDNNAAVCLFGACFISFTNISTDTAGVITSWNISLTPDSIGEMRTESYLGINIDLGSTHLDFGSNQGMPGSWAVTTTPLPAALPLFSGGLAALGLLGWRRKRKNGAAIAA